MANKFHITPLSKECEAAIDGIKNWPIPTARMPPFVVREAQALELVKAP